MPLPQQDEFGEIENEDAALIYLFVSMPLPQQDEFGVTEESFEKFFEKVSMPLPQQDEFGAAIAASGNEAIINVSMPLPQQDEFGVLPLFPDTLEGLTESQCRFRSKMNSEWSSGKGK